MVEARVPARRLRARLLDEAHELRVRAERRAVPSSRASTCRPIVLPVLERALEVRDRQLDGAHVHATIDYPCCVLELRLLRLRVGERERAGADLRVQLVLDPVDGARARIRLRPEVARVGRVAAQLERDQVVLLVRGRRAVLAYFRICLRLRAFV